MKPESKNTLPTIVEKGEIVLYQPDESIRLEVRIEDETVWLTQQQIADLFGVKQPAISKHLKNIFNDGELDEKSVYSILEYTAADGNRRNRLLQNSFFQLAVFGTLIKLGFTPEEILKRI